MKLTTLLLAALTSGGCGALDFDVPQPIAEQRIRGSLLGGVLGSLFESPIPIEIDIAAETAARDTGPATGVRLRHLSFRITDTALAAGDADTFDFVDDATVVVESTREGTSLPVQEVARVDEVPPGATELVFDPDPSVDLLPYVEEGARITSTARGRSPEDDVTFDGRLVVRVEVL